MVPAAPGVVRRDGSLAERDIVRFRHVDIEVQLCRQIKRFPGLSRLGCEDAAKNLKAAMP